MIGIAAALVLAVVASGCASSAPAAPTPDPFAGLADRSDQAFRQGLEAYGQGQYRDALTSFEQARLLSPTIDPRIDQMIERAQVALAPQPTVVPPLPTDLPVVPTATSVPMSTQAPDAELGSRYFGNVTLGLVPGSETDAPSATAFFFQDQIGLRIEGLKQHLRLPFSVRVFDLDAARLIAEVQSADVAGTPAAAQATLLSTPGELALGSAATATPAANDFHLVRFWDTFVWYHQGGDQPGRYRLELSANGVLTNTFDYTVGTVPVPTPTAVAQAEPTLDLTPIAVPTDVPVATPAPATQSRTGLVAPAAASAPRVAPTQVPPPPPTIVPTPASAYTTVVGGSVAGLDVDSNTGRFYLADTTGVIWTSDSPTGQERSTLNTPINIAAYGAPVDLAADQTTGWMYVSVRSLPLNPPYPARRCPVDAQGTAVQAGTVPPGCIVVLDSRSGGIVKTISLSGVPSDLRVDADLGLLYVGIPENQGLVEIDMRSGVVMKSIGGLPQITSMALDPVRHTLYTAHLGGQVTVIDARSGQVTERVSMTGAGLSSVATARGLAYAVNTATHEIAVVEPVAQSVTRYALSEEPAAVTASEDTGAVYVLSSRSNVILQIDPTSGFELGRVLLADRSGHPDQSSGGEQTLRPRMVLDTADQTVFASLPELGALAAVPNAQFPISANVIPYMDVPDQTSAISIPGVLRPAADAGPSEPAPSFLAQTPDEEPTPIASDEEGL
ncbi:MAG TPA: hypothetical protein VKV73_18475 [Chloroflexota bacterium]|nr:hypothetical protein [Chloroflexota bacterium]